MDYIHDKSKEDKPFYLYLPLPAPHTPILPIKEYQGKSGLNPYGDFVLMVDDMVGKVMKALKEAGVEENTITASTDNGCSPQAKLMNFRPKGTIPVIFTAGIKGLKARWSPYPVCGSLAGPGKPHVVDQTVCLTDFSRHLLRLPIIN